MINKKCIRCNKVLESEHIDCPYDGISFVAIGNYGSKVWDPIFDNENCIAWLCDKCFVAMCNNDEGHLYFEQVSEERIRKEIPVANIAEAITLID